MHRESERASLLRFLLLAQFWSILQSNNMRDTCPKSANGTIPVIDLSTVNVLLPDDKLRPDDVNLVAKEIKEALIEWGFVYLKNHGISMNQINNTFQSSRDFFETPRHVKTKYQRAPPSTQKIFGYTSIGRETFENSLPDMKECFDYAVEPDVVWPSEIQDFQTSVEQTYQDMGRLALRILHLFGVALELEDPLFFQKKHSGILTGGTGTSFRTLYYPPCKQNEVGLGQMRISEHTDYGCMTLLFQDDVGGLSVRRRDGSFVPATPVKDAVLLNIADLMQRWTNDELISVRHKVDLPADDAKICRARQSMVLFVHPNADTTIDGIKGIHKYPPVNAYEYLWQNFTKTYPEN